MAGAIKTLQFSEGTVVAAPTTPTSRTFAGIIGIGGAPTEGYIVHAQTALTDSSVALQSSGADSTLRQRFINDARQWQWVLDGADDAFKLRDSTASAYRLVVGTDGHFNFQSGNMTSAGIALIGASGAEGDGQIRAGAGVALAAFRNTTAGDAVETLRIARSSTEDGNEVYVRFYEASSSAAAVGSAAGGIRRNSGDTAYEFFNGSDERLKGNIKPWDEDACSIIKQIPIDNYQWRRKQIEIINDDGIEKQRTTVTEELDGKVCKGPIAQKVQQHIPEAISIGSDGYLDFGWSSFYPYWHKAIQELANRLEVIESNPKLKSNP